MLPYQVLVLLTLVGAVVGFPLAPGLRAAQHDVRQPRTISMESNDGKLEPRARAGGFALRSSATETPAVGTKEENKLGAAFDWNKQWYPVASLKDTDEGRAHSIQLLGKNLVLWKNTEGKWATFDDRCPHRAAPLTEGRVEKDGSLMCAYHGWRFDSDGNCLAIPQSSRNGRDESNPAACAKVYPTQVAQDLIWVWAENGPDAGLESTLTPPLLLPALADAKAVEDGRVLPQPVGHRDVAYGWDTLMENIVDPAHVPVSHHRIAGNRYKNAVPIEMETVEDVTKQGFKLTTRSVERHGHVQFTPPCLAIASTVQPDGGLFQIVIYGVPTRPGWSRVIGRTVATLPNVRAKQPGKFGPQNVFTKFVKTTPSWLQHTLGSLFLHQDLVFLHHQEKILKSGGVDSSTYTKATYTPAAADRAVLALRRWIARFGGGGPAWDEGCDTTLPPRATDRNELFDVYQQHTKDCKNCMDALGRVKKLLKAAKVASVVSMAWTVLRGARAVALSASSSSSVVNLATTRAMLPGLAVTAASLGALKVLENLHGLFYTYPYHHQDND